VTLGELLVIWLAVLGLYFVVMSRTADQLPHAQQRQHLAFFGLGLAAVLLGFVPSPDSWAPTIVSLPASRDDW